MSTTTTINPASNEKGKKGDNNKSGVAGMAAAGAGGAAIAATATVFAKDILDDNNSPQEVNPADNSGATAVTAEEASAQAATVEPAEPVVAQAVEEHPAATAHPAQPSHPVNENEVEPVVTNTTPSPEPATNTGSTHTENHPSQTQNNPSQAQNNPEPQPQNVEPVNPGEVAQEILAIEEIDPDDIDVANIVNVDEIGVVQTAEGEMQAVFAHDASGEQFVMVDIDNDNVIDQVEFSDGTVAELGPTYTMDDAEVAASANNTYLAANTGTETENISDDSIEADMISYS